MRFGFDYGSSNCAVGVMEKGKTHLVPLELGKPYLPSTLYAFHNSFVSEYIAKNLIGERAQSEYQAARLGMLKSASAARRELDLSSSEQAIFFGREAISEYIEFPEEGYFVKSPKSFFGAVGIKPEQVAFFEDIATAMMLTIKQRAEAHLGKSLTQTVIGRPVNFQSVGGEQSNIQATTILTNAAKRAGFSDVEFLFEPLAAGIAFEQNLQSDKKVLVVDIGGGTSDCSFVQMGPSFKEATDRSKDFLSHTGKRVGGNDLDIALSYHAFMPLCGLGSNMKSGNPMPAQLFWQACKINDLHLQSEFFSDKFKRDLVSMLREVEAPEKLKRLHTIQSNKLTHQLVRQGELGKIIFSEQDNYEADLAFIEAGLNCKVNQTQYQEAVTSNLEQINQLAMDAISEAGCRPDLIFLTGGSAQSPILRQSLQNALGEIEMVNGDNFGSVTAGLTYWAEHIYR